MSKVTKIIQRVLERYENDYNNTYVGPGHDYVYNNRVSAKIEVLKELVVKINKL